MPEERLEDDRGTLRIRALRGGAVAEVATFLADLENAYNALYWFDAALIALRRGIHLRDVYLLGHPIFPSGFTGEQILPERRLQLNRVVIQSPGFWEVLGTLNPLLQIREYLKDRHERCKDKKYRSAQEERKLKLENELLQQSLMHGELDIFRKRLEMMRDFGEDPKIIEQTVWSHLGPPMSRLGRHQDTGLIEAAEPDEDGNPHRLAGRGHSTSA